MFQNPDLGIFEQSYIWVATVYNMFEISIFYHNWKCISSPQKTQSFDNILHNLRTIKLTKKIDYVSLFTSPTTPAFQTKSDFYVITSWRQYIYLISYSQPSSVNPKITITYKLNVWRFNFGKKFGPNIWYMDPDPHV